MKWYNQLLIWIIFGFLMFVIGRYSIKKYNNPTNAPIVITQYKDSIRDSIIIKRDTIYLKIKSIKDEKDSKVAEVKELNDSDTVNMFYSLIRL